MASPRAVADCPEVFWLFQDGGAASAQLEIHGIDRELSQGVGQVAQVAAARAQPRKAPRMGL
eukprot:6105971-Alexandrium_andersonii.AAC.1